MTAKKYLESKAVEVFETEIECFEYFVKDDLYVLYKMIEERISLDDWLYESSNVVEYFDDKFYYLDEYDLMDYRYKYNKEAK